MQSGAWCAIGRSPPGRRCNSVDLKSQRRAFHAVRPTRQSIRRGVGPHRPHQIHARALLNQLGKGHSVVCAKVTSVLQPQAKGSEVVTNPISGVVGGWPLWSPTAPYLALPEPVLCSTPWDAATMRLET